MIRRAAASALLLALMLPIPARALNAGDPSLQRLSLTPAAGTTFKIVADYDNTGVRCEANKRRPLRARYAGKLEVVRAADGTLALVNELTFQHYLEGLAEVPRSWPFEALKAQVIAARSYALYHYRHGGGSVIGYDLCSTDACQVYRGLQVSEGAFGDAWRRAVQETAGRVLLYRGEPIEAFYFSTSWGRTVSNVEGFGSSTLLPYLKPASGEDDDAPLAHWHAEIPLADLGAILRAADIWSGGSVTSASVDGRSLVVSGATASSRIPLTTFRRAVNNEADCLYPDRYPPKKPDGGRLPQTIPSPHLTARVVNGRVVIDGRGWGHGVGMSQYGAKSLAARGSSASEIVAHFYGGLRPSPSAEPGALRVLLADGAARITIEADGPFHAAGPSGAVGLGRAFSVSGGPAMKITRKGSITPVLSVDPLLPDIQKATTGGVATVRYVLPTSARVRPILRRGTETVARGDEVSQTAGMNSATLALVDLSGAAMPPGLYEITVEATDGIDRVVASGVSVQVMALPSPAPFRAAPSGSRDRSLEILVAIGVASLIAAMLVFRFAWLRRRVSRT